MSTVAPDEIGERIAKILAGWEDFQGAFSEDEDGNFSADIGSTRVLVSLRPFNELTLVDVASFVLVNVQMTEVLLKYAATTRVGFAHFRIIKDRDGFCDLILEHTLFGPTLADEELILTIDAVSNADNLDEGLASILGGQTFEQFRDG